MSGRKGSKGNGSGKNNKGVEELYDTEDDNANQSRSRTRYRSQLNEPALDTSRAAVIGRNLDHPAVVAWLAGRLDGNAQEPADSTPNVGPAPRHQDGGRADATGNGPIALESNISIGPIFGGNGGRAVVGQRMSLALVGVGGDATNIGGGRGDGGIAALKRTVPRLVSVATKHHRSSRDSLSPPSSASVSPASNTIQNNNSPLASVGQEPAVAMDTEQVAEPTPPPPPNADAQVPTAAARNDPIFDNQNHFDSPFHSCPAAFPEKSRGRTVQQRRSKSQPRT